MYARKQRLQLCVPCGRPPGLREHYKHHLAKDGNVLLTIDSWSANKQLGETSMRALCHLDKNSNAAPAL
jgi:hypothetical protein